MRIAVIGTGLAGLAFARHYQQPAELILFEKSRGLGGRLATRRTESHEFDHGAQFFTCRSENLRKTLAKPETADSVAEWEPRVSTLQAGSKPFRRTWFEPHYVGTPGMTALPKALAHGLTVSLHTRVDKLMRSESGWQLFDDTNQALGEFNQVVTAIPAPQAESLLGEHFAHREQLLKADLSPCIALMLSLTGDPGFGFEAAVVRDSPLAWLAVNNAKPGRGNAVSLIAHSSNDWAREHVDDPLPESEATLLCALQEMTSLDAALIAQVNTHRWRFAKVETALEEPFLWDGENGLGAIGDWCLGNRAENAFESGVALANHLNAQAN